jgi:hypothetical protein
MNEAKNSRIEGAVPAAGPADDAIFMLLPTPDDAPDLARARAAFALLALAEEPLITDNTAVRVINAAIDELRDCDMLNMAQNTSMDRAFAKLKSSRWGQMAQRELINRFIAKPGKTRETIGRAIAGIFIEFPDFGQIASDLISRHTSQLVTSSSLQEKIAASFALLGAYYRCQQEKAQLQCLKDEQIQHSADALLDAIFSKKNPGSALAGAAVWALGWLTGASLSKSLLSYKLSPRDRQRMLEFAADGQYDDNFRSWAVLMSCPRDRGEFVEKQADWIYEWALVADGNKPFRKLPKPLPLDCPEIEVALPQHLDAAIPALVQNRAAIALGRLGIFREAMVPFLQRMFLDTSRDEEIRDEALIYLVFCGGPAAKEFLLAGPPAGLDPKDNYMKGRFTLGSIGSGDLDIFEKYLTKTDEDPFYINPFACALAGHKDPRGRQILHKLKDFPDDKVKNAVRLALDKFEKWETEDKNEVAAKGKD